ncbi:MAG: metallopeptidase, partial [Frankiales bacterium]|nr:metallopeptidase [Frankiales bacterium]
RFSHLHNKLGVTPAAVLPARRQFRIAIRYRGNPGYHQDTSARGPVGWQHTTGGSVAYTEPDGTYEWMPTKDVLYDKATWLVHLVAKAPVMGVATGRFVSSRTVKGTTTTTFLQDQPITNYQQMIAFDTFRTSTASINGIRSFIAVSTKEATSGAGNTTLTEMRNETAAGLSWLTARLGPFPYKDTGAIVVSGGDSAMETADRPTYSNDQYYDYSPEVVVHELSHEWFGGRVTAHNTSDLWLHEAFATWLECQWISQQKGQPTRPELLRRRYLRDGFIDAKAGQFGKVSVEAPTNAYRLESTVYYRGAMAVEALYQQLGHTAFGTLLRGLAQQPAGHSFTTSQFVALAQKLSGKDLSSWRTQWLTSLAAQPPLTPPTSQELADEIAQDVGYQVYGTFTDDLTADDLSTYAHQALTEDPTWYPGRLTTVGAASSGTVGSAPYARIELSIPAGGPFPTAVTACLTFPTNLQESQGAAEWYSEHVPLRTDFRIDSVTLQGCP